MQISGNNFSRPIQHITRADAPIIETKKTPDLTNYPEKITRTQANPAVSSVSDKTRTALLELQQVKISGGEDSLNVNKQNNDSYLDDFFSNSFNTSGKRLLSELPPILLPNAKNIAAISEHASTRFRNLLEQYNIETAPEQISYDQRGKIQLPADYPYAKQLKQLFSENPGFERELRTLNALSSHYAEIQKRLPMHEELASASTRTQADAVIAKYAHLLNNKSNYSNITLTFSDVGKIDIKANGKSLPLNP